MPFQFLTGQAEDGNVAIDLNYHVEVEDEEEEGEYEEELDIEAQNAVVEVGEDYEEIVVNVRNLVGVRALEDVNAFVNDKTEASVESVELVDDLHDDEEDGEDELEYDEGDVLVTFQETSALEGGAEAYLVVQTVGY